MTNIRMTESKMLKRFPLSPDMRGKIRAIRDRDLDKHEMPPRKMLRKMFRPGRPAVEDKKVVLSFRADKDVAETLRGLKNWSSLANEAIKKHLVKLGLI